MFLARMENASRTVPHLFIKMANGQRFPKGHLQIWISWQSCMCKGPIMARVLIFQKINAESVDKRWEYLGSLSFRWSCWAIVVNTRLRWPIGAVWPFFNTKHPPITPKQTPNQTKTALIALVFFIFFGPDSDKLFPMLDALVVNIPSTKSPF